MTTYRLSGALLAIALPFALPFATAGAANAGPASSLTLTLAAPDRPGKVVDLKCEPSGGSHPKAKRACAELVAANGDFGGLRGEELTSCTMEYRPVTAVAEGTWRGRPVSWSAEFGNACVKDTATGSVFDF